MKQVMKSWDGAKNEIMYDGIRRGHLQRRHQENISIEL